MWPTDNTRIPLKPSYAAALLQQQSARNTMADKSIWFVTGAGRGMGVDIVKAALAAGHAVVATGRNTDAVARALGEADRLLVVKLDVTRSEDAKAAVAAAVE